MEKKESYKEIIAYINEISIIYNMDKKNIIQTYYNHVIREHPQLLSKELFDLIETIIHNSEAKVDHIIKYFVYFTHKYYLQR
jgi:hypothetical protein